jgi:hypothetical protein
LTESVSFGSIQGAQSVASHYRIWDIPLIHPERLTLGYKDPPILVEGCSPTEEIAYLTDGMQHLGNNPCPLARLSLERIVWNDRYYTRESEAAVKDDACIEACRAAICHDTSYLGWLHALEMFGLCWQDV